MNRHGEAQPLVSIIIPVYNAEKYLGYCLNSIMRQSYTSIEVILINDGSTDGSPEICRRYAAMDPRFSVTDIPNGGVSNARNLGVSKARGEYFLFVDSDDVIHPDTVAWMMEAESRTHTGLIIGNVQMVDFDTGEVLPTLLSSAYTDQHRQYTPEEFRRSRMRLIWHTSLLEGMYGKLYRADTWREHQVRCPADVSLGEDFIANMQYFAVCSGVYFLDRVVYYYNNVQNSNSLSHKFRPDLFRNKMMLMEKLERHLGGAGQLSPEELACFYNYVASSGLFCVQDILTTRNASRDDKLRILRDIGSSEYFMHALAQAEYIHPKYQQYVRPLLQHHPEKLIHLPVKADAKPAAATQGGQLRGGIVNRALRKSLRLGSRLMGHGRIARRLQALDSSLANVGIRHTMAYYSPQAIRRRRNRADIAEVLSQQLTALPRIEEALTAATAAQKQQLEALRGEFGRFREASVRDGYDRAKDVMDYVYLSETRQRQVIHRQLASELRQKKKALLLGTAEHRNLGDAAITMAEQAILRRQFPDYYQVELSTYEQADRYEFIQAIVNEDDIIFISGGGNLGSTYPAEEALHRRIIADFPENKIVILPQTIHFADDDDGRRELALSEQVYNAHPDLTIFARGQQSLAFAQAHFPHARSCLMPDAVFALHRDYGFDREGILLCLRDDEEALLTSADRQRIAEYAQSQGVSVETSTNMAEQDIAREVRCAVVNAELRRFARKKLVITDRLHGMIFAAITGTPVIALHSASAKIAEFYEAFLKGYSWIQYLGSNITELDQAMTQMMNAGYVMEPCKLYECMNKMSTTVFDERGTAS
ncbi:MAG: glycosyltransferase [Aristaeellaceae bacterium]